ncbi:MAG: ABC transporter substrate-binding protein [Hyphomicrobiales bacterium]|nr:ABC transporter substrate-binding protein [Hyphomicrobiales bacterium]MCA1999654.1 ABC transporter substrate-binding protein [Hyphomicrobiales bacterium]
MRDPVRHTVFQWGLFRGAFLAILGVAAGVSASSPAAAQARDRLTLCQTLEPPILDPTAGAAAAIREVTYDNIFEGLVAFDRDGRIVPRLAERHEVSADGLTWRFFLRRDARFHDGAPFTAADVKFSFERALAPDSKNTQKWIFEPIAAIATPAPDRVEITLKRYTADFLEGLAWGDAVILSEASAARAATEPVGTGPYRFGRWMRGDRLVLERNPAWWGGTPPIREAILRFISDPQAQVAALLAGDCDAHTNIGAQEAVAQLRADPRLVVAIGRTEGETIVAMNNARPPLDDLRVRRAIAMAIDRNLVNEGAISGFGTPIGSHFSPNHPAYLDLTKETPFDPRAAKALLAEAGHPNGFTLALRLPPPAYARRGGEIVAAMLKEIGITARIEPMEWPQWLERVFRNKDYDLTIVAHVEPMDLNIYAREDYYFGYSSPAVKTALAAAKSARSEAERKGAFEAAQRQIAKDQVNVFLFMLPKITVARKGLEGLWPHSPIPAAPIRDLRWN